MSEARFPSPRPPQHGSAANISLRADLIAANVFQRIAAAIAQGDADDGGCPTFDSKAYSYAAECSFAAAVAFVAESRRRDPQTGELTHPVDGLPKEEADTAADSSFVGLFDHLHGKRDGSR